jgi:hypothetical protein
MILYVRRHSPPKSVVYALNAVPLRSVEGTKMEGSDFPQTVPSFPTSHGWFIVSVLTAIFQEWELYQLMDFIKFEPTYVYLVILEFNQIARAPVFAHFPSIQTDCTVDQTGFEPYFRSFKHCLRQGDRSFSDSPVGYPRR